MAGLIIGVDPGLTGALAAIDIDGNAVAVHDLPVIRDGKLSWIDGGALQSLLLDITRGTPLESVRAVVERVGAMPKQGISSAFNFGAGFGSVLSILQARAIPIELVTPAVWKRAMGLGKDKDASLNKARLLFPAADLCLRRHDGRAEALLLALWRLKQGGKA